MSIVLQVHGIQGHLCNVHVELSWSLDQIIKEIEQLSGIPTDKQCLASLTILRRADHEAYWLQRVKQRPLALCEAPEEIRENKEIVRCAVSNHQLAHDYSRAFRFAAEALKQDAEFLLELAQFANINVLRFASEELLADRDFALSAFQKLVLGTRGFTNKLPPERVYEYLAKIISKRLWSDKDFVLSVVRLQVDLLRYASSPLKQDVDFILDLAAQVDHRLPRILHFAGIEHIWKDRRLALRALKVDGELIPDALAIWKDDRDMVLAAVKQNGIALRFTPSQFRLDDEIVREAARQNKRALEYVPASFLSKPETQIMLSEAVVDLQAQLKRRKIDCDCR